MPGTLEGDKCFAAGRVQDIEVAPREPVRAGHVTLPNQKKNGHLQTRRQPEQVDFTHDVFQKQRS